MTCEFSENKVLDTIVEKLKQLMLHLLPHGVTLCFTYANDDEGLQSVADDG